MNTKKTAIQNLISELERIAKLPMIDKPTIELAIEFAKLRIPMQKQQIKDAYDRMRCIGDCANGEQYYNKTFKSE
jgi:hypothetical protein